jgi:hypothetical protein
MSDEKKPEPKKLFDCKVPKHPLTVPKDGSPYGDIHYAEWEKFKPYGGPSKK